MKGAPWTAIVIAVAAVLMAAGIVLFERIPRATPDEDDWYVVVKGGVISGGKFSIEGLRAISEVDVRMALAGTGEDGDEHDYRGMDVLSLLLHCGMEGRSSSIVVRAADAYSASFSMDEVQEGGIFLVWEKDGSPLKGRSEGGPGPVRLLVSQAIAGEFNAQRCVKYVSEVEVE